LAIADWIADWRLPIGLPIEVPFAYWHPSLGVLRVPIRIDRLESSILNAIINRQSSM
jgi:hypothetical protein